MVGGKDRAYPSPPRSVRLGLQKGIFMKNKREVGKQDVLIFLHN